MTYNDEICCRTKSSLPEDVKGAVPAKPLFALLRKLAATEIKISFDENKFTVLGKNEGSDIAMDSNVMLSLDKIEKPGKWTSIADGFADAITMVQECASKDETKFACTCIHVHPDWLEAMDSHQLIRYRIKTKVSERMLIRRDSLKHIIPLGMTHFSETETWMHFKNPTGLILSCRRDAEQFQDISKELNTSEGFKASIPKGIGAAVEKAKIFSSDDKDNDEIKVELRPGAVRITGQSDKGRYWKKMKLKYEGKPMKFLIASEVLLDLSKKHHECIITSGDNPRLRVKGDRYVYVTCLAPVESVKKENEDDGDNSED
jgi:DNA polymerase III sliding clamp (beta) subunit (PCNA family)